MRISAYRQPIFYANYKFPVFKSSNHSDYSDIKQKNEYYCAPAACANVVYKLSDNQNKNPDLLVEELAKYLKTDKNGTTSQNLCKGLDEYFKAHNSNINIEYQGFREVDKKYKTADLPDLDKINSAINNGKFVILNLGIYKKLNNTYLRQYGHFINAAGTNSNGILCENNCFTITDPYNKVSQKQYIKLSKINDGKFIHNKDDNENALTDCAIGFYEVSPKFSYFENGETAVINGAIIISK